jgi:hypothetical protein
MSTQISPSKIRSGRNKFYRNRKQAIFITVKSDTAEATDITIPSIPDLSCLCG